MAIKLSPYSHVAHVALWLLISTTACGDTKEDEELGEPLPPGAACDPNAENPNCQAGSECKDRSAGSTEPPAFMCLVGKAGSCDPLAAFCDADLTCAELEDGSFQCHAPLLVRGSVRELADHSPVAGAHVIGLDGESVAVTDVAVSAADGSYELVLPAVRAADGKPLLASYTLRADAQTYQTFPGGLRTAIPFSTQDAVSRDGALVIESSVTELNLIQVPDDGVKRHMASGQLSDLAGSQTPETQAKLSGVLIVAEGSETRTTITDKRGGFTIFNLRDGAFQLDGYAAGVDVVGKSISVSSADMQGVELQAKLGSLAKVSGNVQLVNPGDGKATSVILVVESTFEPTFARGDAPRGLRAQRTGAPSITGAFSITDVPDGRYVVLAGFENDALVRDPDTNISGTNTLHITVQGGNVDMAESFKVTGALAIVSPGAMQPEAVNSAPMLQWKDDSSEDWYEVRVYDAFGAEVWRDLKVPGQSGGGNVSLRYAGPMEVGMYYQFRVTSWRSPGNKAAAPISASEDLRGVFYVAGSR